MPAPCAPAAVSIAPLPPRLVPQSKLGLGLAVYLLLSRFDDHLAYYTLERIFRERHGVIIPAPANGAVGREDRLSAAGHL